MGKKSRTPAKPTTTTKARRPAPVVNAYAAAEQDGHEAAGWERMKRSLLVMLTVAALAAMDPLALKESVTVVAPDHKPLLAVVGMIGWLFWKRWTGLERQGLHPFFRTVGFSVILAGMLALLPFNSTVTMLEVPLLSADECRAVVEATAQAKSVPGFEPAFSVYDPATEVPLQDLPADVSAMVSEALRKQLMPFVKLEYGGKGEVSLDETTLYVEHYEAYHEPPPPAHVRQGQLAVRVELTPPESKYVGGGGVFLDPMGKTITPGMGSGLVLPAKLRHGSSPPGPNSRSVLVGSLTVVGRDPVQRLLGMWHLWGLFSRSIRYVADKSLPLSGVDSIPAPDPEPTEGDPLAVGEGVGGGSEKLDF